MKSESRYSLLDRTLHRLAFSTIEIQKVLAGLEDKVYSKDLSRVEIDRPVFITSLPRAGTTLLLDVIASAGSFASHTYRNLPFLLIPLLWNTISGGGRKRNEIEIERAHGDGMTITYDSHEAFEEVLWRAFWPDKYLEDRVLVWEAEEHDPHDEFDGFFKSHIRKLLLLRGAPATSQRTTPTSRAYRSCFQCSLRLRCWCRFVDRSTTRYPCGDSTRTSRRFTQTNPSRSATWRTSGTMTLEPICDLLLSET